MSGSDGSEEVTRPVDRDRVRDAWDTAEDERLAVLERVCSGLANLDDEPIPGWVARRVDDALAEEAVNTVQDGPMPSAEGGPTAPASRRHADRPAHPEAGGLIEDLAPVTLAVIDFVCTTPPGAAAEPIEVAVQTLRVREGALRRGWAWGALIRPPAHAVPTLADTQRTGIAASMLAGSSPASQVLAELDNRLEVAPLVLVAHDAAPTARLLFERRGLCPRLAGTDLLDILRLACDCYPDLPRHTLDDVATHLGIAIPDDRHRAMPDVQLAVEVLLRMIDRGIRWPDQRTLRAVGGQRARARRATQEMRFE